MKIRIRPTRICNKEKINIKSPFVVDNLFLKLLTFKPPTTQAITPIIISTNPILVGVITI
jgi:hypothetical protein